MDEHAMIDLSALLLPLTLAACFLGGLLMGYTYFHALRATADLIVARGPPLLGLALILGRFGLLGSGFYVAVLAGGFALLAALTGFLFARGMMLHQTRSDNA
ncbi:MAG TPA: ATP synthase subunit I [Hyphomicrobiaceae bacterium]|nr:ATP synthase subunit I [Hyphomicrobiaceae bacterium]